ncbi:hypothetical protein [Methylorubrum populi]
MKWAEFDADGFPRGFYADDIHGPLMLPVFGPEPEPGADGTVSPAPVIGEKRNPAIPAGVVEITEAQWLDCVGAPGRRRWNGRGIEGVEPQAAKPVAPDHPSLSDWRVGLTLWRRPDGTLRIDELTAKVTALVENRHPLGRIARERLEYANHVERVQLLQLAEALGFTEAEIEESLWRAERVRLGDLSGTWPLPADGDKA